jgi:hypothetical protein
MEEKLLMCRECGAIKVPGKDSWINSVDVHYRHYKELFRGNIKPELCRRHNPEYKGNGKWDGKERRRTLDDLCLWKSLVEDPNSTTGQDIKASQKECDECDGYNQNCKNYNVLR